MSTDKKNSLWLSLQYVLALFFSLITLKLNISHFGKELFGVWLLLDSIWRLNSLLDFGFGTSVIKYVAQYKNNNTKISKILSTSFMVFVILGALIFISGNIAAYFIYISDESIIKSNAQNKFVLISLLLGLSFIIQYFAFFFKSIIEGLSNFSFTSKIIISKSSAYLIGVVVIFLLDLDLLYLALLNIIITSSLLFTFLVYFILKVEDYKIRLSLFDRVELKSILKFSFSVQLMTIFNALIDPIIKYIIGNYYNLGTVSIYEVARRFAVSISGLFFNAFKIVLPKASALTSTSDIKTFIKQNITKYSRLGVIYSGFMFGIFSFFVYLIIVKFFKIEEAVLLFLILALPETINNFGYSIYNFLLGIGRTKVLVLIQLNNLVFVVIFMVVGFVFFNSILGLVGYFVSVALANLFMMMYINKHWNEFNFKDLIVAKLYKLPILIIIMIAVIIVEYFELLDSIYAILLLNISAGILFSTDLKEVFKEIVLPLINKTSMVNND